MASITPPASRFESTGHGRYTSHGDPIYPSKPAPDLSIIVPTLNEQANLPNLLRDLSGLDIAREVIVVDGGSGDRTRALAQDAGARLIETEPGRGVQLRTGAALARSPLLCFLHADIRLPTESITAMTRLTRRPPTTPVAFRLAIDAPGTAYRVIEAGTNARSRLFSLPYGDQGLIVTPDLYWRAGGHPTVPLMEDVLLARELRRAATPIRILQESIRASPRRWRQLGPFRTTVRNQFLLLRFFLGASPETLAMSYRSPSTAGRPPPGAPSE